MEEKIKYKKGERSSKVLEILSNGPKSRKEISNVTGIEEGTVYQILIKLFEQGKIKGEKMEKKRTVVYTVV